jgi:hypothetical protein
MGVGGPVDHDSVDAVSRDMGTLEVEEAAGEEEKVKRSATEKRCEAAVRTDGVGEDGRRS